MSDHSIMLNEFGGVMEENDYNSATVETYARKMLAQGTPFILYGFKHKKPSEKNIKALGNAIKGK